MQFLKIRYFIHCKYYVEILSKYFQFVKEVLFEKVIETLPKKLISIVYALDLFQHQTIYIQCTLIMQCNFLDFAFC